MKVKRSGEKSRHSRRLVTGFLERIASSVFSDYPELLSDIVGRQHGVYALYRDNRLYYIGLATNLKGRIKQHLQDRHAGKWNRFSLYLVRKEDHVKELESLILRIADPKGNAVVGNLAKAQNLRHSLKRLIRSEQTKQVENMFGAARRRTRLSKKTPRRVRLSGEHSVPTLQQYVRSSFGIRGRYKGKIFKATVSKDGSIKFNGSTFITPSAAAKSATKSPTANGWVFWSFQNKKGEWVQLSALKKK